jgi:hypothetical protein
VAKHSCPIVDHILLDGEDLDHPYVHPDWLGQKVGLLLSEIGQKLKAEPRNRLSTGIAGGTAADCKRRCHT